jgi:hypothetical protein
MACTPSVTYAVRFLDRTLRERFRKGRTSELNASLIESPAGSLSPVAGFTIIEL